jgi:ubiquinol-cytochrome c reductase cytochrome b subunit
MRDVVAMAIAFAALLAYVVNQHGADLAAPADPTSGYDARPLWYFRWLFELRELSGRAEKVVALVVPAIVAGALVVLPLVDREPSRALRSRLPYLGGLTGLLAVIAGLTVASFAADARNNKLAERVARAEQRAQLARKLARDNGVPVAGGAEVFLTSPMARGRALFATKCKSCHDPESMERKGPVIAPGHGSRDWNRAFVKNPNGEVFWGLTKLAKSDAAMKSFAQMPAADLDGIVELIYSESGATDVDADRRKHGLEVFEIACSDCHAREEGMPGSSAPGLFGVGTRAYYRSFIANPKSALHMGKDKSQMPRFDKELSLTDVDAVAEYLVWLRTATGDDVEKLDPY